MNGNLKWIMGIMAVLITASILGFTAWTANGIQTANINEEKLSTLCKDVEKIKDRNAKKDVQWVRLEYYLKSIAKKMDIEPYE